MSSDNLHIKLTIKEESFCQAYLKKGNKSEAYRLSYSTKNMKPESIHVEAQKIYKRPKVTLRIKQLQDEIAERNKMTLDKVVAGIAEIATFDIAELYDEKGTLKNIHDIPKAIRTAISGIKVTEEFQGFGPEKEIIGFTKDVKIINKLDAYKELMRYFGGYKKDNDQKTQSTVTVFKIPDNGRD